LTIAVLAAVLVVAGCGSNTKKSAGALTATNATASTATPKGTPTAAADVASLKTAGLPVGESFTYDASTDQNHDLGRPNQYIGKASWIDTTLQNVTDHGADISASDGGSIEVFANATDAQNRYNYITALAKGSSGFLSEYDYLHSETLLRLSSTLTPTQAQAYNTALTKALA